MQHSACKLQISSDSFVTASVENLEKTMLIHLGIEPMGGSVVVTTEILVDEVAAEDTSQIHLVGAFVQRDHTALKGLGHTENHQRMQHRKPLSTLFRLSLKGQDFSLQAGLTGIQPALCSLPMTATLPTVYFRLKII